MPAGAWEASCRNRGRPRRSSSRPRIRKTSSSWSNSTIGRSSSVGFTTNTEEIQNRLTFTQAKGRTALLDGVYLAMNQMKKAQEPAKGDHYSLRWRRQQQPIYGERGQESRFAKPMCRSMRSASLNPWRSGPDGGGDGGPGLLTELAESTGGRHFPVENLNELPDVAAKIGIELRNQYVLGYTPTNHD